MSKDNNKRQLNVAQFDQALAELRDRYVPTITTLFFGFVHRGLSRSEALTLCAAFMQGKSGDGGKDSGRGDERGDGNSGPWSGWPGDGNRGDV